MDREQSPTDCGWQYRDGNRDGNRDGIVVPVDTVGTDTGTAIARPVVRKKHVSVGRQGYTVQQCAVTVMDKHAAKLMHCLLLEIQTVTHRCMSTTAKPISYCHASGMKHL